MTRIKDNIYYCDWCDEVVEIVVGKYVHVNETMPWLAKGKQNVTNQIICRECGRYISQKTKLEKEVKS